MTEQIKAQNRLNEARYRDRLDDMNISLHTDINQSNSIILEQQLIQMGDDEDETDMMAYSQDVGDKAVDYKTLS